MSQIDSLASTYPSTSKPSNVTLSNPTVLVNATSGTLVGTFATVGGIPPYNYTIVSPFNNKFSIVNNQLFVSSLGAGNFSAGTNESVPVQVSDGNNNTYTTTFTIVIPAAPSLIVSNPSSPNIFDNISADSFVTTISVNGGTAPYTFTDTSNNTKFEFSSDTGVTTTVLRSNIGTLTPNVNETIIIHVVDSAGLSAPDLTVTITIQDHTASTLITTRTFVNDSTTAATPAGSVTRMWGLPFKKGDIASGTWPAMYLPNGTKVPYSKTINAPVWSDGSLKHIGVFCRIPISIPKQTTITAITQANPGVLTAPGHGLSNGQQVFISALKGMTQLGYSQGSSSQLGHYLVANATADTFTLTDLSGSGINTTSFSTYTASSGYVCGSVTVNVYSNGTEPSASTRTTSDLSSGGLDIALEVDGQDYITGVYRSSLNDMDSPLVYADGEAGKLWRFDVPFRKSGVAEGYLSMYHYAAALTDSSGNLAGIRHLGRIKNSYYDLAKTGNGITYKSFNYVHYMNGTTLVRDLMRDMNGKAVNFIWAGAPLKTVSITNGGSGYTTATATLSGGGRGSGASVTLIISGGVITGATHVSGQYYTEFPIITITGDGTGATAEFTAFTITSSQGGQYPYLYGNQFQIINNDGSDGVYNLGIKDGNQGITYNLRDKFHSYQFMKVSTTGTLPGGLSSTHVYGFYGTGAANGKFELNYPYTDSSSVFAPDGTLGSGVHTLTPYAACAAYSGWYTADYDANFDYFQGGGSVSTETTLRAQLTYPEQYYFRATRLIPPYKLDIFSLFTNQQTNSSKDIYDYNIFTYGPINSYGHTTGERKEIGPMSSWHVTHFLLQDQDDEKLTKLTGLIGGAAYCRQFRGSPSSSFPGVMPNIIDSSYNYIHMPTGNKGFRWNYGDVATSSSAYIPKDYTYREPIIGAADHMGQFCCYPYLAFGEPQYSDMMIDEAFSGIANRSTTVGAPATPNLLSPTSGAERNLTTSSGVAKYGCTVGDTQGRADAWATTPVVSAAAMISPLYPECPDYSAHFNQSVTNTMDVITAYLNQITSYMATTKQYSPGPRDVLPIWEVSYAVCGGILRAAGMLENAEALAIGNWAAAGTNHIFLNYGGYYVASYYGRIRASAASTNYITEDYGGLGYTGVGVSWSATTQLFTITSSPPPYTPSDGDRFTFPYTSVARPIPGDEAVHYYFVNTNAVNNTFQLSYTEGGSPITLAASGSNPSHSCFWLWKNAKTDGTTGLSGGTSDANSYAAATWATLCFVSALGGVINPAIGTDLFARNGIRTTINNPISTNIAYNTDPKYCMDPVYE